MPTTRRNGEAKQDELPSTLRRSEPKAQLVEALRKANDRETEASRGT